MQTETGKLVYITKEGKTVLVAESNPTVVLNIEPSPDGGLLWIEAKQHGYEDTAYILVAETEPNLVFGYAGHLPNGFGFFQHDIGIELPAEDMTFCEDIPLDQNALRHIADFVERKGCKTDMQTELAELGLM